MNSLLIHDTTLSTELYALCLRSITLADTVGAGTPDEMRALFRTCQSLRLETALGTHCHNDLGLASRHTLTAISCGANIVHVTVGRLGERAGNCALEEVAAVLHYKKQFISTNQPFDLKTLHDVMVYEYVKPNDFGRRRQFIFNRLSG